MEALTNEEYSGFNPLGSFEGTLDGEGKSLKNIYINKAGNAGLIENMTWRNSKKSRNNRKNNMHRK